MFAEAAKPVGQKPQGRFRLLEKTRRGKIGARQVFLFVIQTGGKAIQLRRAGELALARVERPEEAQPCWYLHQVWSALGQQAPATRWLQRTFAAAPYSEMTPAEQRALAIAFAAGEVHTKRP